MKLDKVGEASISGVGASRRRAPAEAAGDLAATPVESFQLSGHFTLGPSPITARPLAFTTSPAPAPGDDGDGPGVGGGYGDATTESRRDLADGPGVGGGYFDSAPAGRGFQWDGDGPGVGGGYFNSGLSYTLSVPLGHEVWHTSDGLRASAGPKATPLDAGDGDGPGLGGGYFTHPLQGGLHGPILQEATPPPEPAAAPKPADTPPAPGPLSAEGPSSFSGPNALARIAARLSPDPVAVQRLDLKAVEACEPQFAALKTPAEFAAQTARLKQLVKAGADLDTVRPQAFALARRAADVALGKKPFDSQMIGALTLDSGVIAQMGTGEGKTLTALMPLYLNALKGDGSQLVTVNEYLARVGFEQLKPAFDLLGVSSGLVLNSDQRDAKKAAYAADVTYVSNDTLGFDYLNDRTVRFASDRVQREPGFALLDEADQVLLDEARVPLIIASAQSDEQLQQAVAHGQVFAQVVRDLVPGDDFRIDRKAHTAFLTEVGQQTVANELALRELPPGDPKRAQGEEIRRLLRQEVKLTEGEDELSPELRASKGLKKVWSELLGRPTQTPQSEQLADIRARKEALQAEFPGVDLYSEDPPERVGFLQKALQAHALFQNGVDYIVQGGEVQIVDEFKGLVSEGRRFTEGLHQALEIKEGLEPKPETETIASITYPNLFRRYPRLAGMTGTAKSAEREFNENLGLKVVDCPPNKARQRVDHPDRIFADENSKLDAVVADVNALFEEGVPVLVATRSVEANLAIAARLNEAGIFPQNLNARDVKSNTAEENAIIAQAGQSGVITVATNMAGRGVDIKPDPINYKKMAISCDISRREGKATVARVPDAEAAERLESWFNLAENPEDRVPHERGGEPAPGKVSVLIGEAAAPAGADLVDAKEYPGKKLVVLATERNLDRRVDDQLRGRAGRQGAPGETRFYVSIDDDLMRIYGDRDKMAQQLSEGREDKLRAMADQAQEKVQNSQADIRLQTAKHDQVANQQRDVVWGFRDRWVNSRPAAPSADGEQLDVAGTVHDWMAEAYVAAVEKELNGARGRGDALTGALGRINSKLGVEVAPQGESGNWKERVEAGFRDRITQLEKAFPADTLREYQWDATLQQLDSGWKDQLVQLENEKQGANLEAYAGKEPQQAYIERAFRDFDDMWKNVKDGLLQSVVGQMASLQNVQWPLQEGPAQASNT